MRPHRGKQEYHEKNETCMAVAPKPITELTDILDQDIEVIVVIYLNVRRKLSVGKLGVCGLPERLALLPIKCACLLRQKQCFSDTLSSMSWNILFRWKEDLVDELCRYEGPLLLFWSP